VSLGGLRIYSDFELALHATVDFELEAHGCPRVSCSAQVVRVKPLGRGAPAAYELGLRFVHFDPVAVKVLMHVIGGP
jgi:hypothetical protein